MFSKISFFVLLLSFSALLAIAGDHNAVLRHESGSAWSRRHARARDIVREPRSIQFAARDSTNTTSSKIFNPGEKKRDLEKRFEGARFTFYDAGMGACGATNTNADFVSSFNQAHRQFFSFHLVDCCDELRGSFKLMICFAFVLNHSAVAIFGFLLPNYYDHCEWTNHASHSRRSGLSLNFILDMSEKISTSSHSALDAPCTALTFLEGYSTSSHLNLLVS